MADCFIRDDISIRVYRLIIQGCKISGQAIAFAGPDYLLLSTLLVVDKKTKCV